MYDWADKGNGPCDPVHVKAENQEIRDSKSTTCTFVVENTNRQTKKRQKKTIKKNINNNPSESRGD